MVRCAKMAEPIDMPFWMKTLVDPRNHVFRCGSPNGKGVVRAIHKQWQFRCTAAPVAAKGIIQSPITSCNRRDHSVYQANANGILEISGRSGCGLSAAKGVVDCTARAKSDIYDCLVICCGSTKTAKRMIT